MPSMNRFTESPRGKKAAAAAVLAAVVAAGVASTGAATTDAAGQVAKVAPAGGFKGMG